MLQNPRKTLGYKNNVVYEIPPGIGKPYLASCLYVNINIIKYFENASPRLNPLFHKP